jgi:hypothetical protein
MEFLLTKNPQFSGKFESREVKIVEEEKPFQLLKKVKN